VKVGDIVMIDWYGKWRSAKIVSIHTHEIYDDTVFIEFDDGEQRPVDPITLHPSNPLDRLAREA
jgi:hypothetical protein